MFGPRIFLFINLGGGWFAFIGGIGGAVGVLLKLFIELIIFNRFAPVLAISIFDPMKIAAFIITKNNKRTSTGNLETLSGTYDFSPISMSNFS